MTISAAGLLSLFHLYRYHRDIVVKFFGSDKLIYPLINAFDVFSTANRVRIRGRTKVNA
jgi:hypothetical protein